MKIIGQSCRAERAHPWLPPPWRTLVAGALALALWGCAAPPSATPPGAALPTRLPLVFTAKDKVGWEPLLLPGKLRTTFRAVEHDGRRSLLAQSVGAASMLRQRLRIEPAQLGQLSFQWQVAQLIEGADMTVRELEDSPARVVLAFDGDRSRFSPRNAMLNELTRSLTGEEMPYAMLMYVWSNALPVDTVIVNPRTDRIRKIVVESGPARLQQWLAYQRDVRADFERAFGEPPGILQGLAIMTDSDNTRSTAQAWYGDIRLDARPGAQ